LLLKVSRNFGGAKNFQNFPDINVELGFVDANQLARDNHSANLKEIFMLPNRADRREQKLTLFKGSQLGSSYSSGLIDRITQAGLKQPAAPAPTPLKRKRLYLCTLMALMQWNEFPPTSSYAKPAVTTGE
jgi:hypothetical protein